MAWTGVPQGSGALTPPVTGAVTCCVAFGKLWSSLECQPSCAYNSGSRPFQGDCQAVFGSEATGCTSGWWAVCTRAARRPGLLQIPVWASQIPFSCPARGAGGSTSRVEEVGTLGASACHLPLPKCPGLAVACSRALWAPGEHSSICIDSGVSSTAEQTLAMTGMRRASADV